MRVDTSKPLRRVVRVEGGEGKEFTYVVKYEMLPIFCYLCRCIGHSTKKYKKVFSIYKSDGASIWKVAEGIGSTTWSRGKLVEEWGGSFR